MQIRSVPMPAPNGQEKPLYESDETRFAFLRFAACCPLCSDLCSTLLALRSFRFASERPIFFHPIPHPGFLPPPAGLTKHTDYG